MDGNFEARHSYDPKNVERKASLRLKSVFLVSMHVLWVIDLICMESFLKLYIFLATFLYLAPLVLVVAFRIFSCGLWGLVP